MRHTVQIMGLMWRGQPRHQQDALLIQNQIVQHGGAITRLYAVDDSFIIAVADGVSSSPKAEQAAKQVLQEVSNQWAHSRHVVDLQKVQESLCDTLADLPITQGATTTLAVVQCTGDGERHRVNISHVGDSRIYHYRQGQGWQCLTRDHTILEEMRCQGELQEGVEYASMYNSLTNYLVADRLYDLPNLPPYTVDVRVEDWIVVCTDGVHGIIPANEWPPCGVDTDLKVWLTTLHHQVYKKGAHDNGSLVVARWM